MKFDPDRHHRRSIRLPDVNYASYALFFITLCTYQRECLFGSVVAGDMCLNENGEIACEEWLRSRVLRSEVNLGAFVVMPNHLHAIVSIEDVGAHGNAPSNVPFQRTPRSLATFMGGFKGAVTRRINARRDTRGTPVWQRNYYERIIRDEEEFERIGWYIEDNPRRWAEDEYNPERE